MEHTFFELVQRVGEEQDCNITRGGRHTGLDMVYFVKGEHLAELLDAAVADGFEPKRSKRPRTICFTYSQEGVQLFGAGWGGREKAACILVDAYGADGHMVTWTSSIG